MSADPLDVRPLTSSCISPREVLMLASRVATTFFALAVLFGIDAPARAKDSGPAADSGVAALKVLTATGDDAGKEVDYAAARKDKPTLYVFVDSTHWDRPIARFLRALDEELGKRKDDAHMIIVWLTDDVEKAKEYLPRAQESLKLANSTFTIHGTTGGPADWAINADVTAVAANK